MTHLKEGDPAPAFTGLNEKGEKISLSDFKGKRLIIYFYPKDNTPGCTTEACNLRDNYELLLEKGFAIVGVSADSQQKHTKFIEKFDLPFSLIADTEKEIIKAFGVWGPKKMYGKLFEGIHRITFVIDGKGSIEKIFTKVKTGRHAEQILEAAEA